MSSDSGKDNASVVDSSVTEGKHEVGAFDDPESTSYKVNEVFYPSSSGEPRHCHDKLGAKTNEKWYSTRYFIIKSFNHENIQLSIERGIWATQVMNEPILEEAFNNSGKVILIFSVNMSGFFQGYAQMMSSVGWRRDNVWSQDGVRNNPWGRSFKVKWLRFSDLPFQKTLHLTNPLNDNKPVKISRDCQELPQDIGEALCALLDEGVVDEDIRRDDTYLKRTFLDSSYSSLDDDYNRHSGYMPWSQMPIPPSSTVYQQQAEAARFNFGYQRSALPGNYSATGDAPVVSSPKHPRLDRNLPKIKLDGQIPPKYDTWGLPADSPLSSTLTTDDFLEMSYEDYLEFHRRITKQLGTPSMEPSWTPKGTPKDDDSNSSFGTETKRSHKRLRHPSAKSSN